MPADQASRTHLWVHVDEVILLPRVSLQVKQVVGIVVARAVPALGARAPVAHRVDVREAVHGLRVQVERVPAGAPLVGDILVISRSESPLCELKVRLADPDHNNSSKSGKHTEGRRNTTAAEAVAKGALIELNSRRTD